MAIRLAVIGLGGRAYGMISMMRELDPAARVVAVADPSEQQTRKRLAELGPESADAKVYESADRMLESADQYDGVLIGTHCNLHTPLAIKVAATGLPLFLEKPVAITNEQLEALARAWRGREDRVVVSFPLRYTPLFTATLEVVRSGRLGTINQIQAINNVPYGGVYFGTWYRNYDEVGGLWLQKATHDFDYINLLAAPARPTSVAAITAQRIYGGDKPHDLRCSACDETETCMESPKHIARRGDDGGVAGGVVKDADHLCAFSREIKNEDAGSAIIAYDNGVHASYTQNFVSRRQAGRRGAIITGYSGTVEFDWYTEKMRVVDHHQARTDEVSLKGISGHGGGDAVLAQNFLDVIAGRGPSRSTLHDGLLSVGMCLAARTSAEKRTFQTIAPCTDR